MAKLKAELNSREIIERIMQAADIKKASDLAEQLGLSPQALNNTGPRRSISLPLLLAGQAIAIKPVSLDYLVYGEEAETEENDYISIQRVGGGRPVKFLKVLLRAGLNEEKLCAYIEGQKLYIIDSSDLTVTSGDFAFGDLLRPAIRRCKLELDGTVSVEGEIASYSLKALNRLKVAGRVVWSGASN